MCEKYNGHADYETWVVGLWIENDEGLYAMVREMAEEAKEDVGYNPDIAHLFDAEEDSESYIEEETARNDEAKERAAFDLSNRLKDYFTDEANPLASDSGLYVDLLNAALDNVAWIDIARDMLED